GRAVSKPNSQSSGVDGSVIVPAWHTHCSRSEDKKGAPVMATDERKEAVRPRDAASSPSQTVTAPSRRDDWSFWRESPFHRLTREMDRWFHDASGRHRYSPEAPMTRWTPEIDAFQRGDQFVVRADLP